MMGLLVGGAGDRHFGFLIVHAFFGGRGFDAADLSSVS